MSKKQPPPIRGKIRTREHVIADLAVNHAERQVLLGGGTVEPIIRDYGLDLLLFTYNHRGEVENGVIFVQVKSTEGLSWLRRKKFATFRIERSALIGWLRQLLPVILIVYDATEDLAYWLHVQGYFADLSDFNLFQAGAQVTVHIPASQFLEPATVRHWAALRDAAQQQNEG